MGYDLINFGDVVGPEWRFVEPRCADLGASWHFFRTQQVSLLERLVKRPNIGRYHQASNAVRCAREQRAPFLISHLPRATLPMEFFRSLYKVQAPHLAFAFNFTDLPTGFQRRVFARGFRHVDRFTVFSRYEQKLYAEWFDLDPGRIDFIHWAMERPNVPPTRETPARPFVFAGGGEGRDYGTLIEAIHRLPSIPFVIQVRPSNLQGLSLPPNVTAFTDHNPPRFWRFVADSQFMVLPLRDDKTPCGHITVVGALQLGRAIVATRSDGLMDYTGTDHSLLCEYGDADALAARIEELWTNDALRSQLGSNAQRFADDHCAERRWCEYLKQAIGGLR